jgi:hypothetical protein
MTAREVIERLATLRRVETIVQNVARTSRLTPPLQDLAQMVYTALLNYDPDKIVALWEGGAMDYFIARIVLNQYHSTSSDFHNLFRRSVPLPDLDKLNDEWMKR